MEKSWVNVWWFQIFFVTLQCKSKALENDSYGAENPIVIFSN